MKTAVELHHSNTELLDSLQLIQAQTGEMHTKVCRFLESPLFADSKVSVDELLLKCASIDQKLKDLSAQIRYSEKHVARLLTGDFDADIVFLFRDVDHAAELVHLKLELEFVKNQIKTLTPNGSFSLFASRQN